MAGRKITQLPTLTTPEATDKLVIVDVSDTSESPQGTSKQIALEDIVGGIPDIESGAWNPTPTNTGGTNPIVAGIRGNYSRVGSVVTCSLFFGVVMDAAESLAQFTLDLPIASNFTNAKDAFGIISYNSIGDGEFQGYVISADVAGNQIEIQVSSLTNGTTFQFLQAILQYVII
jgi:hypothetical protein